MKRASHQTAARVTIEDVARAAGVSTGTVSRVLNRRAGVKAATRHAVLEAVSRLEYRPDAAARELSLRHPKRIGFHVAPSSTRFSPFYTLFAQHLSAALQESGLRLETVPSRPDGLPARSADAFVLVGLHDDDARIGYLHAQGIPVVLAGHAEGERWTRADDVDGGRQAALHLLRLGHTELLHVTGDLGGQAAFDRFRAFRGALQEAGVALPDARVLDGGFTTLGAYRAVRRALEGGVTFTGVFAASDEMACGVIAALEDAGLRVPGDVSVVGFDDLPEFGDGLTTVRQDVAKVAATAAALLKESLRGEPPRSEVIPVQLVVRGTTARRR
ncbi:LacI family DNA-binding transcriptional regulator [Truepera radiovictrix]|uniref:Transcriptional regulator, LacI family n=1 Tax=Truepera radiovictrix (strain DSM 17093 / CIP 108686 / LMG 22925 / RQ-24) TaxID=649638 RepID=D7CVR7_TRURR|nr:LacI family DNA-binding transcriptional regulator [Truepera radiovictrix]ADI15978.1 transcriptional regulator, LacI family [Truepera radiovictrix DSM 17093]WMT58396.1 LacI family DNA-binding transcriptional regulator [Truepera radiovictrix]